MKKILSIGKYTLDGELLGCGNFGRVELATHILTNVKVAVKIIDTRKLSTVYASKNLYREARILAQIRHPNIVRMYETLKSYFTNLRASTTLTKDARITPYCVWSDLHFSSLPVSPHNDLCRSLSAYLKTLRNSKMGEVECWPMVRQLTAALVFLHQHSIVHRDLKMDNILLDGNNENIKIIDFGLSNMFVPGVLLKTHCGSPEFAAPELFYDRHDYGPEVDAWSFGVIVYGVLVGQLPFIPGSTEPSKRHALLKMLNKGLTQEHKKQMAHLSIDCRGMLFQLIEPNPELRLGMEKAAEHDWITRAGYHPLEHNIEPELDQPLHAKVISKLSEQHQLDLEYIENHVSQNKYDSISSQYNMLMDKYSHLRRVQKITTASTKVRRKSKMVVQPPPSKPQMSKVNSKKPSSSSTKLSGMMNSKTRDDTFLGPAAYLANNKVINRQALKDDGKLHLSLLRPIITVSGCGTSYGTQDSAPILEYGGRFESEADGSSYVISSEKIEPKGNLTSEREAMHRDSSNSSIQGADNSNQMTTSSASTAIVQELVRDDSLSPEGMQQPSTSTHHLATGDNESPECAGNSVGNPAGNSQPRTMQVHMVKVSSDWQRKLYTKKLTQSQSNPTHHTSHEPDDLTEDCKSKKTRARVKDWIKVNSDKTS